ncbi:MAG: argininosuccinate synthase [Bacteroidetes bacterium]|nr:argininosuccinate synthase [Bacteroidota bacterium]
MKTNPKKTVLLAFSGGLDTTYCAIYLAQEKNLEVHTAIVNTGGFSSDELKKIEKHAYSLGIKKHYTLDETSSYYNECIRFLIYGNVLRGGVYPLSVSAERVFQSKAIALQAKKIKADFIAHGSTGAGNDQVRFDVIFNILIPEIKILTPIRELKLSREEEINFLKENGVKMNFEKALYSINKGLWGTSVGGKETLTSDKSLPEEAFPTQLSKTKEEELEIGFAKGEVKSVNGKKYSDSVSAIQKISEIASAFAIGRDIHIGDTIIGIKGRVGFEAAAPLIIIKAHATLEKHTLTKWQSHWKEQMGNWYGMMLHEGQFLEPVMRNVETFMEGTQKNVTGTVKVLLAPYRFSIIGINSKYDLMSSKFGKYGEMNNAWSGEDVKGFSKIISNQTMIYHRVNEKE